MSSRSCTRLRVIKKRFELKYEIHSCQEACNSLIDRKKQLQERPRLDTLLQLRQDRLFRLVTNWNVLAQCVDFLARHIQRLAEHELA